MANADVTECTRIAATQCGVISLAQALEHGLSKSAIHRLINEGLWSSMHRSVYALWTPPSVPERWRQRLVAGALWLGEGSAASHRAAGIDWGLDGIDTSPLEFSTTRDRRLSRPGFLIHRVRTLPPEDIIQRNGLPVTSVARTLVDLTGVVPPKTLEIALESARHKRLTTVDAIADALARSTANHPGKALLRRLLDGLPSVPTESPKETISWQLFRDAGLPMPVRQYKVCDAAGRIVARPDFAWPQVKIAVEYDSTEWHSRPRDVKRDARKHNAMVRLDWIVYRISSEDLAQRAGKVAADLRELYESRRALVRK